MRPMEQVKVNTLAARATDPAGAGLANSDSRARPQFDEGNGEIAK
jgi:hypothetical protein